MTSQVPMDFDVILSLRKKGLFSKFKVLYFAEN